MDESADEKVGEASAGGGRQHNGRLGKIEQSQVGFIWLMPKMGYGLCGMVAYFCLKSGLYLFTYREISP